VLDMVPWPTPLQDSCMPLSLLCNAEQGKAAYLQDRHILHSIVLGLQQPPIQEAAFYTVTAPPYGWSATQHWPGGMDPQAIPSAIRPGLYDIHPWIMEFLWPPNCVALLGVSQQFSYGPACSPFWLTHGPWSPFWWCCWGSGKPQSNCRVFQDSPSPYSMLDFIWPFLSS
jgi:hypothetical protein